MGNVKGWKPVSFTVTLTSTSASQSISPDVELLTPSVILFADESNTNDIGLVDTKLETMTDAGIVLAARGSVSLEGPQMNGVHEMIDLNKIIMATDTANNIVRVTYLKRIDSSEEKVT